MAESSDEAVQQSRQTRITQSQEVPLQFPWVEVVLRGLFVHLLLWFSGYSTLAPDTQTHGE
jgi:hypothetical protein